MKFLQDTMILALLFLALYFVALGVKYTVNVIPRTIATAMEQVK